MDGEDEEDKSRTVLLMIPGRGDWAVGARPRPGIAREGLHKLQYGSVLTI